MTTSVTRPAPDPDPQLALPVHGPPGEVPPLPDRPVRDWRKLAVCVGYDFELWFPVGRTGPAALQLAEAKSICWRRCPVIGECARWALDSGQEYGVAGGLDEEERRAIREGRPRSAVPEPEPNPGPLVHGRCRRRGHCDRRVRRHRRCAAAGSQRRVRPIPDALAVLPARAGDAMTGPMDPLSERGALAALEAFPMDTVIGIDPVRRRPVTTGEMACRLVYGTATLAEVGALLVLAGLPVRADKGDGEVAA